MRPWIMFTKHLKGWDLEQIMDGLKRGGVDGADLAVRDGYPVNPDNAPQELPKAAKRFADEGLSIPLVTAPGDLTEPDCDYAPALFEACAEAGVEMVKLGYWRPEGRDYWSEVDRCRERIEGFMELAEQTGVKPVIHTHSGPYMALNASAAMHLVDGYDADLIGVFADAGHLAINGEPPEMAFDIVGEYLCAVAFKDLTRERIQKGSDVQLHTQMWPMGLGFGDFPKVMAALKKINFDGPISFHCEYSRLPHESIIKQLAIDTQYIRDILEELEEE